MSTTRRVFPEVFKREAVDRVISGGLPVGKVATELGLIHHSDRAFSMPPSLIGWPSRDQALHPR